MKCDPEVAVIAIIGALLALAMILLVVVEFALAAWGH